MRETEPPPAGSRWWFRQWAQSLLPESMDGFTVAFDGKTVCSTVNMKCYDTALHIVSARISELGLTFGQEAVQGKNNEIPATQRLIKILRLKGCVVVADALNCQKDTAAAIIAQKADYLLSVKENHPNLKRDIADFVQDKQLRATMSTVTAAEKNRGRIEKRTAFVTNEIDWLMPNHDWVNLCCIGALHTRVESMHWLLDVHFAEDVCRVQDENTQKALNIMQKIVINFLRMFRDRTNSKRLFSNIMLNCLIDPSFILDICSAQN